MQALANSAAFWVQLILLLWVLYLLPTLIAVIRQADQLGLIFVVNLIGGTTGVGWLAAMILAFGPRRPTPVPSDRWPPIRPPASWSPLERSAEVGGTHNVVVLRADAGEPDNFGSEAVGPRRGAGARSGRSDPSSAGRRLEKM